MWFVLCCVVSRRCASPFPSRRRVAVPFGLYFGPPPLFIPGVPSLACVCIAPRENLVGSGNCPLPETSRRLTRLFHTWFGYWPNPTCRSVGKMCTSRVLVLNLVPHTPFLYSYLLMLFSRDYGGRETMFENSKDPFFACFCNHFCTTRSQTWLARERCGQRNLGLHDLN